MHKPLPIGVDEFKKIREDGYYYVDKTLLIKKLIDSKGEVNLFTRPRRFGKTLALSMLRAFFEKEYDRNGAEIDKRSYFDGLAIMESGEEYSRKMGRYPVISLSLKSAKQTDFKLAYGMLKRRIAEEFQRHSYVMDSIAVDNDRIRFEEIMNERGDEVQYADALAFLSRILRRFHGEKTILLIDEYDVPLENAWFEGFYKQMADCIRSLLESALKTNESLEFAVITGCLRITKESIFTGLNNFEIISLLNDNYAEFFGFTQQEVSAMLDYYCVGEKEEEVRKWYDGYLFGQTEVYNPWSMINYVKTAVTNRVCYPKPYWSNTSSNSIIRELVEDADMEVRRELERLMEGGTIEKPVHEEITYEDIHSTQDNLWNFLFFTGYLKKTGERFEEETLYLSMAIPNAEVKSIYRNSIMQWMEKKLCRTDLSRLHQAVAKGDADTFGKEISGQLQDTISYYDYAENYYHGFLTGLLKGCPGYYVESNRESGTGRPDIIMRTPSVRGTAIIMELKVTKNFEDMEKECEAALFQIEERNYMAALQKEGFRDFIKYGICFYRKECLVRI